VFKGRESQLEPEWVAVLLIALIYDGQIVLALPGNVTLDAGNVDRAATLAVGDLANFRHYGRPKDLPLAAWKRIFEGAGPAGRADPERGNARPGGAGAASQGAG
jgi:hypothetical protein